MAEYIDYAADMKRDLLEQFKGKPRIEALVDVLAEQMQDLFDFFEQLRSERDVYHSVGKQLDGVGDIAVLTRMEAGKLMGNPIPVDIIEDDLYRQYLIYKILKNTCDCTYHDIIKAFGMFWDRPLYYSEDPQWPATMIFDTGEMQGFVDTRPLFTIPLLRAAGVTLKIYARTSTNMGVNTLYLRSGFWGVTETKLPEAERRYNFNSEIVVSAGYQRITYDKLPIFERDCSFGFKFSITSGHYSIANDTLPINEHLAYEMQFADGSVNSVIETPINGIIAK
ncbi:MAG: DUF2612 domain-containing protein [Eubacterium sp.]|nr:DUF2612 domain-containing protein [Eubacterium sp.]